MVAISEVVEVQISVQSSAIAQVGFDSILVLGKGEDFNAGWANNEVRRYTSFDSLSGDSDLKPDSATQNLAQIVFAQSPGVPTVYVTRNDGSTPVAQESNLLYETAPLVDTQVVEVFIDGTEIAASPIAWDTDNDTTMDAVAAAIQAETEVSSAVAVDSGSGSKDRIDIVGSQAGESFQVTSNIKTGTTVDEAVTQDITQEAAGELSSSDLANVSESNDDWFGYVHTYEDNVDAKTAATYCASNNKYGMFLAQNISDLPDLNTNFAGYYFTGSADSLAKWVQGAALSAYLGRQVGSYNPAYLRLEAVDETNLSSTDEQTLFDAFGNIYTTIAGVNVTYDGHAGNGGWIDTYINVQWLEARVQEAVTALLIALDKVPYTDEGIALVTNEISAVLQLAEDLGVITSDPKFQVTAPLASNVSATDKSNRILNNVSFVAVTASPVNRVKIVGTLVD